MASYHSLPLVWWETTHQHWHHDSESEMPVHPTGHQSLSILLYVATKTLHCRRTMPPSCTKWWSCNFWEWVWPLEIQRLDMVAFTLHALKILYSSVWKIEGRTICSTQLGCNFIDFCSNGAQISTSLYINFSNHLIAFTIIITKQSVEVLQFGGLFLDDCHESKCLPYTCAYTNHHIPILLDC